MLKIIEKRRSVRDYRDKLLDAEDQKLVDEYINSVPQIVDGLTVTLRKVPNAEACCRHLDGHAGYHGVMISAPYYIIVTAQSKPNAIIAGGYAGEWFVLNLTRHNIGTCWISANHSEQRIAEFMNLPTGEEVIGIIGYGYAESEVRIANVYGNESSGLSNYKNLGYPNINSEYTEAPVSGRISLEEIVHVNTWGNLATIEKLETYGYDEVFYYMRLAPSSVNRQPWRFLMSRGNFVLAVSREDGYDDDRLALLEAGIAMLYFEVAMHDSGYPGKWVFNEDMSSYQIPDEYLIAGLYTFN